MSAGGAITDPDHADIEVEKRHPRWGQIWANEPTPGFDKNSPAPALVAALKEGIIPDGRALIPGCGRGYDVTLLASPTRYVLGIDLEAIAIEQCQKRLDSLTVQECPDLHRPNCDFQVMNFFDINNDNKFDFIYDYTFLCALNPSIRRLWASKMADLTKKGGLLFTLIFPIRDGDDGTKGPPHAVSLELIRSLLEPVGFLCEKLSLLEKELCHPGRDGGGSVGGSAMGGSGIGLFRRL